MIDIQDDLTSALVDLITHEVDSVTYSTNPMYPGVTHIDFGNDTIGVCKVRGSSIIFQLLDKEWIVNDNADLSQAFPHMLVNIKSIMYLYEQT